MEIKKTCIHCGAEFSAQSPKARYCSPYCKGRHCKEEMRRRFEREEKEEHLRQEAALVDCAEILKPGQAASYLGISRPTVYRYIKAGIIPAVRLPGKTMIRKKDIAAIFDSPPPPRERAPRTPKPRLPESVPVPGQTAVPVQCIGYISVPDLAKKYQITTKTVKDYLQKHGVPEMIYRTCRYFEAEKAERAFRLREKNSHPEIREWYTVKEIMARYDMEMHAVYNMVHDHNIPRRHYKNSMLYSKAHVDRLRAVPDDIKKNYATVQDLMDQYHFTHSQIHNRLNRHDISRKMIVKTLWVNRKEFESSLNIV